MATLEQAIAQMRGDGMPDFPPGHPLLNTTRIIRYGQKKRAWYRLYEVRSRAGNSYVHGAYGIWGALDATKIATDWTSMDAAERARVEAEQAEAKRLEGERRTRRAQLASNRAKQQWHQALADGGISPYLSRKKVAAEKGLRFLPDGTLLVPMVRYDSEPARMVGLQKIAPDGTKRFNKDMAKEGAACRLGGKPKEGEPILLAEGLATGLSVRAALTKRHPLFIAFDCGNLLPVARILRAKYPGNPIVVCADDDYLTICDRHRREGATASFDPDAERFAWCRCNPGISAAVKVVAEVEKSSYVRPVFAQRAPENPVTDFNDLHVAQGIEAVTAQIDAALAAIANAEAPPKKKKHAPKPKEFWDRFDKALQEWALIRGTDTMWDAPRAKILKVPHVRLAEGKEIMNFWLASDRRRTVEEEDVVFDPTGRADPEQQVNLFTGMKTAPASRGEGSCAKLLELLHYLCGEDDQVFDWVLKWCAYPLQHMGAKMATAVVMYGKEGAGKGLWWRAMRSIYDPYSALITQRELESDFNAWASRKLLVIGNEVVSRQERQHHVGYLKNLITEEVIQINDKHLPLRQEANHMQIVFLSNELQPLQISPDDRRYLIIRTPPTLTEQFYNDVVAELDHGGAGVLYRYLLDLDIGDFHAHTKPIVNEAKRSLIELGKSSPQLFFQDLQAGLLPTPFGPCWSQHLYTAFLVWCSRNGDRVPVKSNRFSEEMASMEGVRRAVMDVTNFEDQRGFAPKRLQRTVFVMGARDQARYPEERDWVNACSLAFFEALNDYRK